MKKTTNIIGYSLVEVLVAVAILMLSIVGPMTIAVKGIQSAQYTKQQNTAFFLAQEGISIINAIRNNAELEVYTGLRTNAWFWVTHPSLASCFTASGCNIDFRDSTLLNNVVACSSSASACNLHFSPTGGRALYRVSGGTATPFQRVITLTKVGADEVLVQSEVKWNSKLLKGDRTVALNTSLFNLYK